MSAMSCLGKDLDLDLEVSFYRPVDGLHFGTHLVHIDVNPGTCCTSSLHSLMRLASGRGWCDPLQTR